MAVHHKEFLQLALRRFVALGMTFAVVSLLLLVAIRSIPGDPVALRLKNPDPVQVAEERERLGLDRPFVVQAIRQGINFWSGNWGTSFGTGRAVTADVRAYLPATLELAMAAIVLGVLMGAGWALLAESTGNRFVGAISYATGMAGLTVPIYWLGLLFIIGGSLWLGWFPSSGRLPPELDAPQWSGFLLLDTILSGRPALFGEAVRHLFLPALCLSLYPAAQVCATLRARLRDPRVGGLLSGLRARGLSARRIWLVHILKLVAGPVVTIIGTTFGVLLGGAVLTETVFSWPGMGRYLVSAVLDRDIYVIQNALLLVIFMVLAVVQLSDMVAVWLNPASLPANDD